ncbi:hypothetical protein K4H28_04680 [Deefgea tanakiae]|uniref:Lipoprotein n=1 Tax=Deefgea tanakiae TaxID=2865840 RepID=A0ABX8ZA70_9NEIS|nr:hypothetical protein [Deefgea tanakiae]QZA78710.1 hypothetical protein K4H28_04680 [Deefgea tanakiae]
MLKSLVLVLSFVLAGCASMRPPVENGRLNPPPGQGLAIIALTAQSFSDDTADLALHISGPSGRTTAHMRLATDFIRAPGSTHNSTGRLLVLALPAGQHMITNATGSWRRDSNSSMFMREFINVDIQQPFNLAAGEVVYLGQVHVNMNFRSDVRFSQNIERDFFDLNARSGVTDVSNIVIRPLNAAATVQ